MNRKPLTFEKEPQNKIKELKFKMKNLELRVIILSIEEAFITKQQKKVQKLHVADSTGSIYMNVFDEDASFLNVNDILYINGAYASIFQDQLILYQGKFGILKVIGDFNMQYSVEPNLSFLDPQLLIQKEQQINK